MATPLCLPVRTVVVQNLPLPGGKVLSHALYKLHSHLFGTHSHCLTFISFFLGFFFLFSHSVGAQVIASGSVQVPRFTLLQSGGLQIQPVSFQDSGEFTCIASNSEGTINATATLTVWSKTHTDTYYGLKYIKQLNMHFPEKVKQTWNTSLSIPVM